jgi:limonene-1,2-epoxide hydrolase
VGDAAADKALVKRFWETLYVRDWEGLAAFFAADAHYEDVPAPDPGADGPGNIVKRLRIGLEPIERQEHETHRVVAEAGRVVTEHTETWHFDADHVVALPFVSIHEIEDGKIRFWRDYWDLGTLMSGAPPWWLERLARASAADFGAAEGD